MSTESVQPNVEPRTLRAVTESMDCEEVAQALFEVTAQSGRVYTVDLQGPVCQCQDFQYLEEVTECKHIRRVRIEVGQVDLVALEDEIARFYATYYEDTGWTLRRFYCGGCGTASIKSGTKGADEVVGEAVF